MKNLYESLLDDEEDIISNIGEEWIRNWLEENCHIEGDYNIHLDKNNKYIVDVSGSVSITNKDIENLPYDIFSFGEVFRNFSVNNCTKFKTLKGCPISCGNYYDCGNCKSLKTLEGAPYRLEGYLNCYNCTKLENIEHLKLSRGIRNHVGFNFSNCFRLKNLKGLPGETGYVDCTGCRNLVDLEGAPHTINGYLNLSKCKNLKTLNGIPYVIKGVLNISNTPNLTDTSQLKRCNYVELVK